MTIEELLNIHQDTCEQARNIMIQKNHDYTNGSNDPFANFRMSKMVGVEPEIALLVRCMDKFKRIETYVNRKELWVEGENVFDSIRDVINYMILLMGLIDERNMGSITEPRIQYDPWKQR